jgi:hypothetical protein
MKYMSIPVVTRLRLVLRFFTAAALVRFRLHSVRRERQRNPEHVADRAEILRRPRRVVRLALEPIQD